jgi:hypothetical protein
VCRVPRIPRLHIGSDFALLPDTLTNLTDPGTKAGWETGIGAKSASDRRHATLSPDTVSVTDRENPIED